MKFTVYQLTFKDGSSYIGSTKQSAKSRLNDHLSQAKFRSLNGKSLAPIMIKLLECASKASGHGPWINPKIAILSSHDNSADAVIAEEAAIKLIKPSLNVHHSFARWRARSKAAQTAANS